VDFVVLAQVCLLKVAVAMIKSGAMMFSFRKPSATYLRLAHEVRTLFFFSPTLPFFYLFDEGFFWFEESFIYCSLGLDSLTRFVPFIEIEPCAWYAVWQCPTTKSLYQQWLWNR